jgi:transcriptional regulator with XRE-family HTH domain
MPDPFFTHRAIQYSVRRLRLARGWTLYQLSHKSGIRPSTLSMLENGHNGDPRISTVQRLARALEVTVCELLRWDERDGARPRDDAVLSQARADRTDE